MIVEGQGMGFWTRVRLPPGSARYLKVSHKSGTFFRYMLIYLYEKIGMDNKSCCRETFGCYLTTFAIAIEHLH